MSDDELAAIRERHDRDDWWRITTSSKRPQAHEDRAALLAEIERLRADVERLREALKGLVAVCDDVLDTRRGKVVHLRRLNAARAALEGGR